MGIISLAEGLNRKKRQRQNLPSIPDRLNWDSSLLLPSAWNVCHQLTWVSGLWTQARTIASTCLSVQLTDRRPWGFSASIIKWTNTVRQGLLRSRCQNGITCQVLTRGMPVRENWEGARKHCKSLQTVMWVWSGGKGERLEGQCPSLLQSKKDSARLSGQPGAKVSSKRHPSCVS